MILSQHIKECQELLNTHGDLPICYAVDDEGNQFNTVIYPPSPVNYSEELGEVLDAETDADLNYICIN